VQELLLTLGIVAALGSFALGVQILAVETLLGAGLWLVGGGLLVGLPASAVYHALLRRSLLRVDALPAGWYWNPTSLHARIPAADRSVVLGFCFVGAAGFVGIVAGCAAIALAAWRSA
jgi:hypothetical protein